MDKLVVGATYVNKSGTRFRTVMFADNLTVIYIQHGKRLESQRFQGMKHKPFSRAVYDVISAYGLYARILEVTTPAFLQWKANRVHRPIDEVSEFLARFDKM